MARYTKFWHIGTIGSSDPALCGKKPPGGRPWKKSPDDKPMCPKCKEERERRLLGALWLAA